MLLPELQTMYKGLRDDMIDTFLRNDVRGIAKRLEGELDVIEMAKTADGVWVPEYHAVELSKATITVAELFDVFTPEQKAEFVRLLQDAGITTMQVGGEVAIVSVMGESVGSFAIQEALVADYLAHNVAVVGGMFNTMTKRLVGKLAKGIAEGDTSATIARTLLETFDSLSLGHATMVAETETAAALNYGTLNGYAYTGAATKGWMAFPNASKGHRQDHSDADARYYDNPIPLDEPFIVGGEALMYPADPSGSFGQTHLCRCVLVPGEVE